jgi:hypothetical protein
MYADFSESGDKSSLYFFDHRLPADLTDDDLQKVRQLVIDPSWVGLQYPVVMFNPELSQENAVIAVDDLLRYWASRDFSGLETFVLGADYTPVDLDFLAKAPHLKVLQVNPSELSPAKVRSFDTILSTMTELETVSLPGDVPLSTMKTLNGISSFKTIYLLDSENNRNVIDSLGAVPWATQWLEPAMLTASPIIPDSFKRHHMRVRGEIIHRVEEELKEKPAKALDKL